MIQFAESQDSFLIIDWGDNKKIIFLPCDVAQGKKNPERLMSHEEKFQEGVLGSVNTNCFWIHI